MTRLAQTPTPPYYAVIFTSITSKDTTGYSDMSEKMFDLAAQQPGYLGIDSAREKLGITVSYWRDVESIKAWKKKSEHLQAQKLGRDRWYVAYTTRIAKVERAYSFDCL